MGNLVSAQLLCYINGRFVGEITGIQLSQSTSHASRMGLDSLTPYALDPASAHVSGTVSVLRRHASGGLEGRGIVAPFRHIPIEKYFSMLLVDRATGKRFFQADFCKVTSQSWSMGARQRVEGSFSFDALDAANEAEYP